VEDPQPAPAKQVPLSPPGQHGEGSAAQTPGSLPPLRRLSPGTETPPAEPSVSKSQDAGKPSQADEQLEEPQPPSLVADQMAAGAMQLALALAAEPAPTAVTVGDTPASASAHSESAEQAADHLQDDVPGAGSLALRVPGLPAVVAARRESPEAADEPASAAPTNADRRASMIMMDAEHTPEVSSCNMHGPLDQARSLRHPYLFYGLTTTTGMHRLPPAVCNPVQA